MWSTFLVPDFSPLPRVLLNFLCNKNGKEPWEWSYMISIGTKGGRGTGGVCPPSFHKLLCKLLTTLCVVSTPPTHTHTHMHTTKLKGFPMHTYICGWTNSEKIMSVTLSLSFTGRITAPILVV